MKERPILFSGAMVRALQDGSKTQTRRVLKPQPIRVSDGHGGSGGYFSCDKKGIGATEKCRVSDIWVGYGSPYGQPGDQLWVRETFYAYGRWETRYSEKKKRDEWHFVDMTNDCDQAYQYAADNPDVPLATSRGGALPGWHKRPAIFMPRVACRIQLEITSVRVERLQDINEADALAEGATPEATDEAINAYRMLWESLNGPDSWLANPWVWVVEFKRVKP